MNVSIHRAAGTALLMLLGVLFVAGAPISTTGGPAPVFGDSGTLPAVPDQDGIRAGAEVSSSLALHQNSPNPFNPRTTIRFRMPEAGHALLEVYNLLGCAVATLLDEERERGSHAVFLDASLLPSGVYFYRLTAGDRSLTRRMVVQR